MSNRPWAAAVIVTFAFAASGCVYLPKRFGARSASLESCPPGHRWSDGRCHDTGKGHDPAKHRGKSKKRGK